MVRSSVAAEKLVSVEIEALNGAGPFGPFRLAPAISERLDLLRLRLKAASFPTHRAPPDPSSMIVSRACSMLIALSDPPGPTDRNVAASPSRKRLTRA